MKLSPGSKGWISKYFNYVEKGQLILKVDHFKEISPLKHSHWTFSRSGIIFGIPTRAIFGHPLDTTHWTEVEKLKVLLFEAHLFTYLKNGADLDKEKFVETLLEFYGEHHSEGVKSFFSFLSKESPEEILEKILSKRVDIKTNIIGNKWWVNSLNNGLAYIDVILFHDFIDTENEHAIKSYADFALNILTVLTLAIHADGEVDEGEKDMFDLFLASANLSEGHRNIAKKYFKEGATFSDIQDFAHRNWLFKRYLMDIALLSVYSKEEQSKEDKEFIQTLREFLDISEDELNENIMFIERYLLANKEGVEVFSGTPAYEKVLDSFTSKWKKILLRNKDKFAQELSESKELLALMKKSMSDELSKEEKKKVKTQLKDLLKTMPSVTIFMIPGGSILLPMMVKLIPDLLPSAFQDNKLEE